ncbi:uncharacterized protein ACN427_006340 isoform 1-T1 [Glossina fuscipes fuscipes]
MINGKFFTGLPPRMIDRHGTPTQNRLESHLYWPDDTKVDSAIESKVKRRNSVLSDRSERPQLKKQISTDDDEVDVKERFQREFTKSSIQFYDNLNEDVNTKNTRRLARSSKSMRNEIAEKPTATKLEMPESVVDEAYTAAKKQQAYTSKIQFYDYVNEPEPQMQRNNMRKPKMDMNDKRDVELNTKNSPKLQVKHNVRTFSEEKEKSPKVINNNESQQHQLKTSENIAEQKEDNLRKSFNNRPRYREDRLEHHHQPVKMQHSPDRLNERRHPYRREPLYDHDYRRLEDNFHDYEQIDQAYLDHRREKLNYQRDFLIPEPRRVLRNHFYPYDYEDIEERMNNMHLRGAVRPRRVTSYQPEWDDRSYGNDYILMLLQPKYIKTTPTFRPSQLNMIYGYLPTCHQSLILPVRGNYYNNNNNYGMISTTLPYRAKAVKGSFKPSDTDYNNYNNNDIINTLNSSHTQNAITINKTSRNNNKQDDVKQTPREAPASTAINMKSSQSSERRQSRQTTSTKNLKHLRSSLCFHDGEIIADNDVKE